MKIPLPPWLVLCLLAATPPAFAQRACDEQSARLVASAYTLSIPPILGQPAQELQELLDANAAAFAEDGAATRCMQALGTFLLNTQPAPADKGPTATEMYGGRMPEGLGSLPGEVDREMSRSATVSTPADLGLELLWLADVLPAMVRGDSQPFQTTGTPNRQMARQGLAMLCQTDAASCQQFIAILDANRTAFEAQILEFVQAMP